MPHGHSGTVRTPLTKTTNPSGTRRAGATKQPSSAGRQKTSTTTVVSSGTTKTPNASKSAPAASDSVVEGPIADIEVTSGLINGKEHDANQIIAASEDKNADDGVDDVGKHAKVEDEDEAMEETQTEQELVEVNFAVPERQQAEDFEPAKFIVDVEELAACLQAVLKRQTVEDFKEDSLSQMVSAVVATMRNFTVFANRIFDQLETVRDQMKSATDFMMKKILQPMEWEQHTYKEGRQTMNALELELTSRHQQLNSQLAVANEHLQRASVVTIETQLAANKAIRAAERAAEEARQTQAEYEAHVEAEREAKRLAEERRAEAERAAAEAALEWEREQREEEERRAALRKPSADRRRHEIFKDWPIYSYHREELKPGGYRNSELTCVLRAKPDNSISQETFHCQLLDPLSVSSVSTYEAGEELISHIIHIALATDSTYEGSLVVALPYNSPVRSGTREAVIKVQTETSGKWEALKTEEFTLDENELSGKLVEAEVTSLPASLIVVSGLRKEFMYLPRHGHVTVSTELDKNITFLSPPLDKREYFTLQVHPLDADVKLHLSTMRGYLSASAVTTLAWTTTSTFSQPVTMTVGVPPSAATMAKLASERAARRAAKTAPSSNVNAVITSQQQQQQQQHHDGGDGGLSSGKKQQRWYMGQYSEHDEVGRERVTVVKKTPAGKWKVDNDICVTQVKDDLVEFDIHSPLTRFIVLRTRESVTDESLRYFAESIEYLLHRRPVVSLVRQHWDNPCRVVHALVPPSRLERVMSRLADDGFDEGPEPSKPFSVSEGGRLELSFHGNVCRPDNDDDDRRQSTPLVFHVHADTETKFMLSPVDKFLQKHLESYRGVIHVHRLEQAEADGRRELVASHHVNIQKELPSSSTRPGEDSIFVKSPVSRSASVNEQEPTADLQQEALRYVAREVGDEWPALCRSLHLTAAALQTARRRAQLQGFSDQQTRLEVLTTWFRAQPRSADKIGQLRAVLNRSGRSDLARQLDKFSTKA